MDCFCDYFLCGICFQRNRETKKEDNVTKKTNLKLLKDITPLSGKTRTHNLLDVKTQQISDYFKIPNNELKTEYDVFKSIGYKLEGEIDSGGFATIHKVINIKNNLVVVCKKMTLPEDINEDSHKRRISLLMDIKNELNFLEKIIHPNVIKMIRHLIIETTKGMTFYILMQMAVGGNLSKKLMQSGPFLEKKCLYWFAQILSGMSFMHSRGFAHRDLKLANILLDETEDILISDFGLSRLVWRESENKVLLSRTYCGTPLYMAPEVLEIPLKQRHTFDYKYNAFAADIWSLGVILFKLFNRRDPFDPQKPLKKRIKDMKNNNWEFSKRIKIQPSEQLKDIVKLMLEAVPQNRITMKRLIDHNWIKSSFKHIQQKNSKYMNIF